MTFVKHLLTSCLFFMSMVELQATLPLPSMQPSFSIAIKQVGMPSLKTFYKVPVEVSITNTTDSDFHGALYWRNLSLLNSEKMRNFFIALGSNMVVSFALHTIIRFCLGDGDILSRGSLFIIGLISLLSACNLPESIRFLKAHETFTIKGYLSVSDMELIQSEKLVPRIAGRTIGVWVE